MAQAKHNLMPAPRQGNKVSRRGLLAAAPAFGFAGLIGAGAVPAIAATETPVMAMFREWQRLYEIERQVHEASETGSDDSTRAATDALIAIERQLIALPVQGPQDVLVKIAAVSCYGAFADALDQGEEVWAEVREMIAA